MKNPFSAGNWVCGENFFGRKSLIASILSSNETCDWVIGQRRIGKTSLLRQIEHEVNEKNDKAFGLYWDIQGSYDGKGFFDSLYDALEDSLDQYQDKWKKFELDWEESGTAPKLLKKLSKALQKMEMRLFLLIDEAEELINIGKQDPVQLSKLRRFFQTNRNVHTVLASTPRLEQLYKTMETNTSPFLHGFNVSFLGNLEESEGIRLLSQGIKDPVDMEALIELTGSNPFETQLFAKHFFENRNISEVKMQLETNPMLNQTMEVNLDLLNMEERIILEGIQGNMASTRANTSPSHEKAIVFKLVSMGYLKNDQTSGLRISSSFMAKHLAAKGVMSLPEATSMDSEGVPFDPENVAAILKSIVDIYQILLELAQKKKRGANILEHLKYVSGDQTVYLDFTSISLFEESRPKKSWEIAVEEITNLLDPLVDRKISWSVFRLHQMKEEGSHYYTEKDFLDLMMLIAEEASLEDPNYSP